MDDINSETSGNEKPDAPRELAINIDSTFTNTSTSCQQVGCIPSLGVYSDSSDSESSSSDSDILPSLFSNFSSKTK